jgi:hypothetical protein
MEMLFLNDRLVEEWRELAGMLAQSTTLIDS